MAVSRLRAVPEARTLPKQIGSYEIISALGVGGMARVYLGLKRGPGTARKLLAIKQVRAEIAADENFLAMFVDEARIALRLSHPNVISTFDVVAEPGEFYMALEYLEGQSLAQVLRRIGRENMPRAEHLWILTQILAGLHYAHTLTDYDGTPLGIVHRDVSPSNVFITYTGQVKLLDFGIAKAIGGLAETQQGMIKGKLGYAAPEQCLAKPVDSRSDVYAVGVMLWEALALRRRAVGETAVAMVQARVQDAEARIEEVWPDVPSELAALTRGALSVDPERRFASASELERALQAYLARLGQGVGQAAVAQLMAHHFAADREAQLDAVENYLSSSQETALFSVPQPTSEKIRIGEGEPRSFTTTGAVSSSAAAQAKGAAMKTRRLLGYGLPACAVVVALLVWLLQSRGTPSAAEAATAAASTSANAAPSALAPPTQPATPTTAEAAQASSADAPRSVREGNAHGASTHAARAVAAAARRAAQASGASVPAPAQPTPTGVEPGADLGSRAAPHAARGIDEKDPYSK